MPHLPRTLTLAVALLVVALLAGAQGVVQSATPAAAALSATGDRLESTPAVELVADIWPGRSSSYPSWLVDLAGVSYFVAGDSSYQRQLWRSDGTVGGTLSLGIADPAELTTVGDAIYFRARSGLDEQELWRTDGTTTGTTVLTSTPTPSGGSYDRPEQLTAVGDRLFFTRSEPDGSDVELWTSDGTVDGTHRVADVRPGAESSYPRDLTAVGDTVYFTAYDSLHGRELWRSDGTALGTVLVADVDPAIDPSALSPYSGPDQLTAAGSAVYFVADDAVRGRELWTSDGTALGTHLVDDVSDRPGSGSRVGDLTALGDRVFFMAHGDTPDRVLWISDGTETGTRQISDVGSGSFSPWLTVMGDHVYFNARDDRGHELWRSDGTRAGTALVADINPVPSGPAVYPFGSQPTQLTAVGGELFFIAHDEVHGRGLWGTDGTTTGTRLVEDLEQDAAGSFDEVVNGLTAVGVELYLTVADNVHGAELWSTAAPAAALPKVVNDAPPTVVGTPAFEQAVTVDPGAWSPAAVSFAYAWYAGEVRLDETGPSLTLGENLVGDRIRVLVTASSPGHRTRSALSEPTAPVAGTVRNEDPPRILGTARVGAVLTTQEGSWTPASASFVYQWFVQGVAQPVGSERTFRVPAGAAERRVTVRVIGTQPRWDSTSAVSAATAPVALATMRVIRRPVLTGGARVGSRLIVSTGSTQPAASRTTIRWLRDGRPITGATRSTYRLRRADLGARISARITWQRNGCRALVTTTRSTREVRPRQ